MRVAILLAVLALPVTVAAAGQQHARGFVVVRDPDGTCFVSSTNSEGEIDPRYKARGGEVITKPDPTGGKAFHEKRKELVANGTCKKKAGW